MNGRNRTDYSITMWQKGIYSLSRIHGTRKAPESDRPLPSPTLGISVDPRRTTRGQGGVVWDTRGVESRNVSSTSLTPSVRSGGSGGLDDYYPVHRLPPPPRYRHKGPFT